MKKLCAFIVLFAFVLSFAACGNAPAPTQPTTEPLPTEPPTLSEPTGTVPAEPPEQTPMFSVTLPVIHDETHTADGELLFSLSYQEMSLILPDPDVAEKIILHYLNSLETVYAEARNILTVAKSTYAGQSQWQAYSCSSLYHVKRIDSNLLSLHGAYSSYSGAVHPTHITQSANYDLITGDHLTLEDILADATAADAVYTLIVEQLNDLRADKQLYPDFAEILKDTFRHGDFSNWYFDVSGLCFCFSPYEIAPYATGTVEVTIPYEQLRGILSDVYFPMEWAYEGEVVAEIPAIAALDRFTQMSELTLDADGEQILLHSGNTAISNLTIEYQVPSPENNGQSQSQATVLGCATLSPGDAVLLKVTLNDTAPVLRISYLSGSQTIVKYISRNGTDGSIELLDS